MNTTPPPISLYATRWKPFVAVIIFSGGIVVDVSHVRLWYRLRPLHVSVMSEQEPQHIDISPDLPIFFEQQIDPEASYMAAFTPSRDPADRAAFMAHWREVATDKTVRKQTILFEGQVAGNIVSFEQSGEREVGYWIGKEYWGKGIATQGLAAFLQVERTRPLYGYTAQDNLGSQRVLQKNGFMPFGETKQFSNARDEEVEALILILRDSDAGGK